MNNSQPLLNCASCWMHEQAALLSSEEQTFSLRFLFWQVDQTGTPTGLLNYETAILGERTGLNSAPWTSLSASPFILGEFTESLIPVSWAAVVDLFTVCVCDLSPGPLMGKL